MSDTTQNQSLEGGTYEIIKGRLLQQKEDLLSRNHKLNEARKEVFGSIETKLKTTDRINTENNCIARDIISIGNVSIFGYNVHFGLRTDIGLNDVFSIYEYQNSQFKEIGLDLINDARFTTDFQNLYKYYRNTIFARFSKTQNYLYMVFQLSEHVTDIKVFKWLIKDHKLEYIDDRSEQEYKYPNQFEFKWQVPSRDMQRYGLHPHISILDEVFVETVGGDLTIKLEDNTDEGLGIYAEPVEYRDQTLDDGQYKYGDLGNLILLEIKPFQEKPRYFAFNKKVKEVKKIDSLQDCCILLPDEQGIIFPTGYYLQTGEYHIFDRSIENIKFLKKIASPNGEDYLFVFYSPTLAEYNLMIYNVIDQTISTPIFCNGYTLFDNGELCYFKRDEEQTKHHVVQIWQTPFSKEELVSEEKTDSTLFKIGNKDIVAAMSEVQALVTLLNKEDNYNGLYEDIAKSSKDVLDSYYWLNENDTFQLTIPLKEINNTANSAIDEFEKVRQLKKQASQSLTEVNKKAETLFSKIKSSSLKQIDDFVQLLAQLRELRGEVITLKEVRYIDTESLDTLDTEIEAQSQKISNKTVQFLLDDKALIPYEKKVEEKEKNLEKLKRQIEVKQLEEEINEIASELELLIDIVSNLDIEDTAHSTEIIDKISLIFARLNQLKASVKNKKNRLGVTEAQADFKAQMTLIDQSLISYFDIADTVEKLDDYQNKISIQLEDLESKFAEYDEFLQEIITKREEIYSAFEGRKTAILEKKNKRILSLVNSTNRILVGIKKKASTLSTDAEINGYFASDLMINKLRDITKQLSELGDSGRAEEVTTKLKMAQQEAIRQLKDKKELFEEGEHVLKLGNHRFGVNNQEFTISIIAQDNQLLSHISGTDFYLPISNEQLYQYPQVWNQELISENESIYRGAYLAQSIVQEKGLPVVTKYSKAQLKTVIQNEINKRLNEGYVKGVHDEDAQQILVEYIEKANSLGMLKYAPKLRAMVQVFWNSLQDQEKNQLKKMIQSSGKVIQYFPESNQFEFILEQISAKLKHFSTHYQLFPNQCVEQATLYLYEEFSSDSLFELSHEAKDLTEKFKKHLNEKGADLAYKHTIEESENLAQKVQISRQWIQAYLHEYPSELLADYADEAICILLFSASEQMQRKAISPVSNLKNMKGVHPSIQNGQFQFNYHKFVANFTNYNEDIIPQFKAFREAKLHEIKQLKDQYKIHELQPDVLSSFIRNKLIDQVYLPLIGDNLAKQIGSIGDGSRTDRMGMLLLISPPGYGKTTLMEYIASRLGLAFMKVNGPAIGHSVTSLDPESANNSASREELKKINLAFEMGNNVMLYLDDIQHCNPEFLQKFISLADGTRRIEGVFKGKAKTYHLRSKKFCVVMAGNPYTEQGTRFQIPDMLTNRSDIYNLGDIIGDSSQLFKQSLIENAVTSNAVLNQLRNKNMDDLYMLMRYTEQEGSELDWKGKYSNQEITDYLSVMKKIVTIRDTVLLVNDQYIKSAAMEDSYRTEPPFKLQGSYRDMNKLVSKVVPIMNDVELHTLLLSHYESESQTLTSQAEANLLKYKELTNQLSEEEQKRWESIKEQFQKNNRLAGLANQNELTALLAQLQEFTDGLEGIKKAIIEKK